MPITIRSSGEAQVMNLDATKPALNPPVPDAVHPKPAVGAPVPAAVHPKPVVNPPVPDAVHLKPAVPDAVHPNPIVKTTAPDSSKTEVHPAAKQALTVASPKTDNPNAIPGGPTAKPQPSSVHSAPVPSQAPLPTLPHGHTKHWPNDITMLQTGVLVSLPIIFFATLFIVLKIVWKSSRSSPRYAPTSTHENESTPLQKDISLTQKGANIYGQGCLQKFDIVFLVSMALAGSVLTLLTYFYEYHLLHSTHFWLMQVLKFAILMVIALCGGSLCRHCCEIDVRGYTVMSKSNRFRVVYTQKFHLFATYLLFLAVKAEHRTLLGLAWGAFFCLLTFLVLIKPIREKSTFFMLQFNSLDCPEDRPDTLQQIIALNLVPGMLILLFFVWLLAEKASLLFILVLVTGVGAGLADTIGTTLGTHAYISRECFSWRVHMHTLEGSAYVFLAAMIFPLLQYAYFSSFLQVLLAMLLLPPVMTLVEATSLQACKIPALLISGGAIIYVLTVFA
uniref:Uncharacterized protein AlNc14C178G8168 n=1 Tax=Albugo laibachii Nc14 TaxID=890382 RepID=F0WP15_9STRA|nr:conserved hypothetical protein [Albugo laibachii Nc14]|eukprot:CCA23059.1 conserved hypothetical protein [Albugo laibachii Nc14]